MENANMTTPETINVATSDATDAVKEKPSWDKEESKSLIRKLYSKSEWSHTLELIGFICLVIIIYVAVCELEIFCVKHLFNIPKDAFLRRYQILFCLLYIMIFYLTFFTIFICSIRMTRVAFEIFLLIWVKHFYVEGRDSYKWWQKKNNIKWIIFTVILLLFCVIEIELLNNAITVVDNKNTVKLSTRSLHYGGVGLVSIYFCMMWWTLFTE